MRDIWQFPTETRFGPLLYQVFSDRTCPCCPGSALRPADQRSRADATPRRYSAYLQVLCCTSCGWWFAFHESYDSSCGSNPDEALRVVESSGAALTRFDLEVPPDELGTLQQEVKLHLGARGPSVQWRAMEDATVGVLRAFGYQVEATTRSKDGGIDALLYHPSKGRLFVQVKHSKNTIEVEVLRELVGTMVIRGAHNGLLVTSSRYSDGVTTERSMAEANGRVIELVDGDQFLAALNLTARLEPPSLEEILAVAAPRTEIIREGFDL